MPKAILEFNLNEPDDITAHKRAVKALDMSFVLFEFAYNSKKEFENSLDGFKNKEDLLDAVYDKFWDLLKEHSINIDELVN